MIKRAFFGRVYFQLKLSAFKVTSSRVIRAVYAYTPEWAYWSRASSKAAEPGLDLTLHLLASRAPRGDIETASPIDQVWVPIDSLLVRGILKPGIYMNLKAQIDREARLQDNANRSAAGLPPAADAPELL